MHQFIQRDKPDTIILDVDILSALVAGLVRCVHIDRLYKLSEGVRVKFFDVRIIFLLFFQTLKLVFGTARFSFQ